MRKIKWQCWKGRARSVCISLFAEAGRRNTLSNVVRFNSCFWHRGSEAGCPLAKRSRAHLSLGEDLTVGVGVPASMLVAGSGV
jgi:hypothetical protein